MMRQRKVRQVHTVFIDWTLSYLCKRLEGLREELEAGVLPSEACGTLLFEAINLPSAGE